MEKGKYIELIKTLKPFMRALEGMESNFYADVSEIEAEMQKATGIGDIEFFWSDSEIVGIGSADRKLPLIHREDLDEF